MRFLLPIIFSILITHLSYADTITLKSGSIVEGKIISKTHELIKITSDVGITLTYYQDEIDSIKKSVRPSPPKMIIKKFYLDGKIYKKEKWENSRLQKTNKWYNPDGSLLSEDFFEKGRQNLFKNYYKNGMLRSINDTKGNAKYYDEEGALLLEKTTTIIHSENFYNKNGTIIKTRVFQNNVLMDKNNKPVTGEQTFRDEKGNILLKENYQNGTLHGALKIFYSNGTLQSIQHYKNGVNIGINQTYYKNSQIKKEEHMVNGKTAKEIIYDKTGNIIYSETSQSN